MTTLDTSPTTILQLPEDDRSPECRHAQRPMAGEEELRRGCPTPALPWQV